MQAPNQIFNGHYFKFVEVFYTGYLEPNNLIDNTTYMANDAIPDLIEALCN